MISRLLVRTGVLALPLLAPAGALAQGVTIDHKEIGCIVAGKYPKMNACFAPASLVKKPRVYFRPETLTDWYYVEMSSDAPCHSGVLLRPNKALIGKTIFYYVDAQGGSARTPEYAPVVVASEEECKTRLPVAPLSATGPAAVYPSFPTAGFVGGGGVSTGVVAGGVAAAAVVAGGAKLLTDDNNPAATTPPTVPASTAPTTTPPVTVPPTTVPPSTSTLVVACQASPRNGEAPLRVDFATFPNGGTGVYGFEWTFGDGGSSTNPNPSHTFVTPGVFNATVLVTSGSQTAACSRSITVTTPPTPPPPTSSFKLDVSLAGTGSGQVTGPGITCGMAATDCSELYASGTVVTLTATPDKGATFVGWSGACSGTGTCTVTMTADKSVTAKFEPTVTLTVTVSGPGTVTGTGINCPTDCTESYAAGSPVTLTAIPDIFLPAAISFWGWSGDCTGLVPVCALTMTANKNVLAQFGIGPPPSSFLPTFGIGPAPTSEAPGTVTGMSLSTTLEMPDGEGQVILNGRIASAVRPGLAALTTEGRRGLNRVEAVLVSGAGRPGTWRFEFGGQAALKADSLRVVAGTVALITGDAIVFRLQGKPGERAVFTFEVD